MKDLKKGALGYYDESTLYEEKHTPEDWEYDDMATQCYDAVTDWIEKQKSKYFYAWINDFGWRNASGHKVFKAETGQQLLRNILPQADCTFYIYEPKKEDKDNDKMDEGFILRVLNYHHDSPTGETYYIRLATEEEIETIE